MTFAKWSRCDSGRPKQSRPGLTTHPDHQPLLSNNSSLHSALHKCAFSNQMGVSRFDASLLALYQRGTLAGCHVQYNFKNVLLQTDPHPKAVLVRLACFSVVRQFSFLDCFLHSSDTRFVLAKVRLPCVRCQSFCHLAFKCGQLFVEWF